MTLIVSCPTCQKQIEWKSENSFRPFCSKRCQLIDLGEWADENHKVTQPVQTNVEITEEMLDSLEDEFLQHNKFFVDPE